MVVPPTDTGVARSDLGNIPAFYGKPVLPIVLDLTIVPAPHTLSSGAVFYPLPSPDPRPLSPIRRPLCPRLSATDTDAEIDTDTDTHTDMGILPRAA